MRNVRQRKGNIKKKYRERNKEYQKEYQKKYRAIPENKQKKRIRRKP